jgi:hypothetical protein
MIDFIKMIQVPLEGLFVFFVVFFLTKFFILKFFPLEELSIDKNTVKKDYNWVLIIVAIFFVIFLIKVAIMNKVPKSKIQNREYIDNGQTRFEQNCKAALDTTKKKK